MRSPLLLTCTTVHCSYTRVRRVVPPATLRIRVVRSAPRFSRMLLLEQRICFHGKSFHKTHARIILLLSSLSTWIQHAKQNSCICREISNIIRLFFLVRRRSLDYTQTGRVWALSLSLSLSFSPYVSFLIPFLSFAGANRKLVMLRASLREPVTTRSAWGREHSVFSGLSFSCFLHSHARRIAPRKRRSVREIDNANHLPTKMHVTVPWFFSWRGRRERNSARRSRRFSESGAPRPGLSASTAGCCSTFRREADLGREGGGGEEEELSGVERMRGWANRWWVLHDLRLFLLFYIYIRVNVTP